MVHSLQRVCLVLLASFAPPPLVVQLYVMSALSHLLIHKVTVTHFKRRDEQINGIAKVCSRLFNPRLRSCPVCQNHLKPCARQGFPASYGRYIHTQSISKKDHREHCVGVRFKRTKYRLHTTFKAEAKLHVKQHQPAMTRVLRYGVESEVA
ncbi:hypothetical protein F5148DRAFT_199948 [Russula earlei]|uniref:Uncharacterized protein n=1 Tax=Russula earlei TaxID=71964 RepID=A0ACC0U534_9AGAM|nr:hypothetical protein F5148DRAFT_199948 [Russula earlei]